VEVSRLVGAAIEFRELTKYYGRRRGVVGINLDVREGEVFGFLGPNGAGKTTTIRLLLGFIRPTSGRAIVLGRDAWSDAAVVHHSLAYLSGEPAYLGELTGAETLDFLGRLRGLEPGAWRPLAERLELDTSVHVRKLSRGNRQKVGLVQVFMGQEPLLVMDEPTTGLDPLMQREFLALAADARAAGRTVFVSSHNLTEVERSCDRVGIVRDGELVAVRSVSDLLGGHARSVNVVLDASPPAGAFDLPNVSVVASTGRDVHLMVRGDPNPLLRRIAELNVRDIEIATPDIEDVFLGFYDAPDDEGAESHGPARTSAAGTRT
jgi:ABC-2 type transport system ATP-binding protein